MDVFKVTVSVDGRDLEAFVKAYVLATIETEIHQNQQQRTPQDKVSIFVGQSPNGPAAWIQVFRFDAAHALQVTHEGWVSSADNALNALSGRKPASASLVLIQSPPPEVIKCHDGVSFGSFACCTSYSNGCYVTCCNSCCSDSAKCPGASCCG